MSKILTREEVDAVLSIFPGSADADIQCDDEGPFYTINWRDMAGFYSQVPPTDVPWTKEVYDCDKFTRWTCAHINRIWAKTGATLPLLHGQLGGDVPLDGNSGTHGWHSLCFFIDEDLKLWLYGAQERSIKNQSALAEIKSVSEYIIGG